MDFQNQPAVVTATPNGFSAKLIGSIHTNTAWIESEFKRMIAANPAAVDLDLSETTFLSSLGIGLLVWLKNKVEEGGGVVRVVSIRKRVLSTLKFARLDELFQTSTATVLAE